MGKKNEKNYEVSCPLNIILKDIGNKWAMLILHVLSTELELKENYPMRFGELYQNVEGISQKMLTKNLKILEANGLINRKVYPQIPPRVDYALTPLGKSLIPTLTALYDWAESNLDQIMLSKKKYS
jgi:DNA-binding HxlR family transcriptional regulator